MKVPVFWNKERFFDIFRQKAKGNCFRSTRREKTLKMQLTYLYWWICSLLLEERYFTFCVDDYLLTIFFSLFITETTWTIISLWWIDIFGFLIVLVLKSFVCQRIFLDLRSQSLFHQVVNSESQKFHSLISWHCNVFCAVCTNLNCAEISWANLKSTAILMTWWIYGLQRWISNTKI